MSKKEICLLVLGKTGNGKSTLGNNILGQSLFPVKAGLTSNTKAVSIGNNKQKHWKVVDTKDILNQLKEENEKKKEVQMWKKHQPSVILLAVKAETSYFPEEFGLYLKVKYLWGPGLTERLAVVFTFGEACNRDIEYELEHASDELRTVLHDAKGRYCVFGESGEMPQKMSSQTLRTLDDIVNEIVHGGARAAGATKAGDAKLAAHLMEPQLKHFNILVIGKTGSGKSTVGNILLGEDKFKVHTGMKLQTTTAQIEECKYFTGAKVQVIDTPDILNIQGDQRKEVKEWKIMVRQQIDIILLCIRTDRGYTAEEYAFYDTINGLWGDGQQDFKSRLVVAFTCVEPRDKEKLKDVLVKHASPELNRVLDDARKRFVTFDLENPDGGVSSLIDIMTDLGLDLQRNTHNKPD